MKKKLVKLIRKSAGHYVTNVMVSWPNVEAELVQINKSDDYGDPYSNNWNMFGITAGFKTKRDAVKMLESIIEDGGEGQYDEATFKLQK